MPYRGKWCCLLAERMTLVKQTLLELGGCHSHMKERSISPTCVKPLIDEVGEREGLSQFQMFSPQDPFAATVQQPTTSETQYSVFVVT